MVWDLHLEPEHFTDAEQVDNCDGANLRPGGSPWIPSETVAFPVGVQFSSVHTDESLCGSRIITVKVPLKHWGLIY